MQACQGWRQAAAATSSSTNTSGRQHPKPKVVCVHKSHMQLPRLLPPAATAAATQPSCPICSARQPTTSPFRFLLPSGAWLCRACAQQLGEGAHSAGSWPRCPFTRAPLPPTLPSACATAAGVRLLPATAAAAAPAGWLVWHASLHTLPPVLEAQHDVLLEALPMAVADAGGVLRAAAPLPLLQQPGCGAATNLPPPALPRHPPPAWHWPSSLLRAALAAWLVPPALAAVVQGEALDALVLLPPPPSTHGAAWLEDIVAGVWGGGTRRPPQTHPLTESP